MLSSLSPCLSHRSVEAGSPNDHKQAILCGNLLAGQTACSQDGKLYAVGGQDALEDEDSKNASGKHLSSVEVLDLQRTGAGAKWTLVPSMAKRRGSMSAACWEGKLYAVGVVNIHTQNAFQERRGAGP